MKSTVIAALITGACTLVVGFWGGKTLVNNITINADGKNITLNGKDIEELVSENERLNSSIETLKLDAQSKEKELVNLQNDVQVKDSDIQNLKTDVIDGITLIVDSVEVTGKYIGVAKNGELLLSTEALGEFWGKPVIWDARKNTVYVGDKAEKPAIEVKLWEKNHVDSDKTQYFLSDPANNAFGFKLRFDENLSEERDNYRKTDNYIVYALNAKAKKIEGDIFCDFYREDHSDVEIVVKMLNENDEILYTSPIISFMSPEVHFKIDSADTDSLKYSMKLKILVEAVATKWHWDYSEDLYIKNLIAVTTDY